LPLESAAQVLWLERVRMDAREYEKYVARLVKGLDCFKAETIETNRRFSGVRQPGEYEVDVAIEISLNDVISFLLIIECKNWKRPVDRPVIQKVAQTRDAIAAHKAAVVSPVGFTSEAVEVSRVHGIALWVIAEGDWEVISRATGPPRYVREYQSLRLSLLETLEIVAPILHRSAVVGFSHVSPMKQSEAAWRRYVYGCSGGVGISDHGCRPGVDDRTALSEIADAMFAETRRNVDRDDSGIVGAAKTWLVQTEQRLMSDLGLDGEEAALAAQAVTASDMEAFRILTRSQEVNWESKSRGSRK
jgi:hypothetical protein